jgi:hypothetical protein
MEAVFTMAPPPEARRWGTAARGRIHLVHLAVGADAGVVEDHIQAPEVVHRRLGEGLHRRQIPDVQGAEVHRAAARVELARQGAATLLVEVAQQEPSAFRREAPRRGGTDARRGPRNQDHLALEAFRHVLASLPADSGPF